MSPSVNLKSECDAYEPESDKFCMCKNVCEQCLDHVPDPVIRKDVKVLRLNATASETETDRCIKEPFSAFSFSELPLSKINFSF